ncbi:MAG: phosphoribosylformylglycinamidine cyclo-ligase [Thermodesulfobacteriota bacterium]
MKNKGLTYRDSGVDIREGQRLVKLIAPGLKKTMRKEVQSGLGGFGALFDAGFKGMKDPVLVSSTDGVGTKLLVAFMAGKDSTVGIDLVAMNVNDILTAGAEPLFFLDYFATGRLRGAQAARVVKGIADGCLQAGCALIGGETAEMPGLYKPGEYDLAGFAVGVVEIKKIIDGRSIKAGDHIIGLHSSGLHSNGYSLARAVLFERLGLDIKKRLKGLRGRTLGSALLEPTRIYVKPVLKICKKFTIKGMAHITGGGFLENIPRVLPDRVRAEIEGGSWPVPPIFTLIQSGGGVDETEMLRTFNCGIGFIIIVSKNDSKKVLKALEKAGEKASLIGSIGRKKPAGRGVVFTGDKIF